MVEHELPSKEVGTPPQKKKSQKETNTNLENGESSVTQSGREPGLLKGAHLQWQFSQKLSAIVLRGRTPILPDPGRGGY